MRLVVLTALATVSLAACGQNASSNNEAAATNTPVNSAEAPSAPATPAAAPATKEEALKVMHERHEGMEQIGKSTKTIKRQLDSSAPDVARNPEGGGDDRRSGCQVAELVPARHWPRRRKDRRQGRDLAELGDFAAKDADFRKTAQVFNATAASGNLDAIKSGFADLGKSCKACHDKYRSDMHH